MKKRSTLRPLYLATALAFTAVAATPLTAFAANPNQAVIDSVAADPQLVHLTLVGHAFSSVKHLALSLSGVSQSLPIVSATDSVLVALLPAGIAPRSIVWKEIE